MTKIITLEDLCGKEAKAKFIDRIINDSQCKNKIGTETELLLYDHSKPDGFPTHDQIGILFQNISAELGKSGYAVEHKSQDITHGFNYSLDGGSGAICLDVSTGQLEISGIPHNSIKGTHLENVNLIAHIKEYTNNQDINLLGLGLRPGLEDIPRSLKDIINRPERYSEVFVDRYQDTLAYNAVNHAFHVNIGVSVDDAIDALQLFTLASPAIISLFANSHLEGLASFREYCWHKLEVVDNENYVPFNDQSNRIGLFPQFLDFSTGEEGFRQYLDHLFTVSPFLTVYHDKTVHIPELSRSDFNGLKQELHENKNNVLDTTFAYTVGTFWPVSRLKFDPLVIEIRGACLQSSNDRNTSITAFCRGLWYNRDEAKQYLDQFDSRAIVTTYDIAIGMGSDGWHWRNDGEIIPNEDVGKTLWGIAREGLRVHEPYALKYLERTSFRSPALILRDMAEMSIISDLLN